MLIKDAFGNSLNIRQAKNGKIVLPFANTVITLSKEDANKFSLYEIEDFDVDAFNEAYK